MAGEAPGDLMLMAPGASQPTQLASDAHDPALAARPDGELPIVVAWETNQGGKSVIKVQAFRTN